MESSCPPGQGPKNRIGYRGGGCNKKTQKAKLIEPGWYQVV